ncbi:MAG: energy transducer TonB [Edaphobacter sp.]|nr:energy transducer TonB [Edaphobacter sp.]
MMSAYANSVQKPERFDLYVRKFRSICMLHGVHVGSRKELPAFLRKLIDDRHLAMDFWGFIGKVSEREGGELSDDQTLGVIVEGITDSDISEQDGGAQRTVNDLRALLAGVDIQSPEQSQVVMAPFPRSEPTSQRADKHLDKFAHAEDLLGNPSNPPPIPAATKQAPTANGKQVSQAPEKLANENQAPSVHERQAPPAPEKLEGEASPSAVLSATPPPQLDEALLRLELTRLVQQYFDNIDKRISKLEPPAEGEPGTIAPAVTRRSLEEPLSAEEFEELRLRRMGRTRLVLESAPPPVEVSMPSKNDPAQDDDDVPMRIPLEHYSPPQVYGKAPVLFVLLLVGAAFAIYRDPTLLRKGFALVVRQLHSYGPVTPSNRTATSPSSSPAEPPVRTEPSRPPVQSALEGTSTPPSPASPPEQKTSFPVPQAVENNSDPGSHRTTTDRAVPQTTADGIASAESAGAVRVNPSVMDENLIVQRVPAYPEVAKMSRVEGEVVMQALISKDGTVKRLHVMEGDSRLRSAAEEAVYKWRYRPYVLHGQPVEVATTVTVNFNLDRR